MPDPIQGAHLQLRKLNYPDIVDKLDAFGEWSGTLDKDFIPVTAAVDKCMHEEREEKMQPILDALGYEREVRGLDAQIDGADQEKSVEYQILRIRKRTYVYGGPSANMIPVRIRKDAVGHDEAPAGSMAAVGEYDVTAGGKDSTGRDEMAATGSQAVYGTIYDPPMDPLRLAVGQKVHLKRRVIVDPGITFLLIRLRDPGEGT
jgi:hypothetical protein